MIVAVEVETGKSDVVKNVKADLMFRCTRIVVVATDMGAFEKVERELLKEGLLGVDRIEVVLREGYFVENK